MMLIFIILIILDFTLCYKECEKVNPYCYCDAQCLDYGDCCRGHKDFGKPGRLSDILTCSYFNISKIWLIDKCKNRNHPLTDYCLKKMVTNKLWKSFIPVITKDNFVYENVFCAECNGVNKYTFANLSINCFKKSQINPTNINQILHDEFVHKKAMCKLIPQFEGNQKRICEDKVIESCPDVFIDDDRNIRYKCVNGSLKIRKSERNSFKNNHCCYCWNETCYTVYNSLDHYKFSYTFNFNEWDDSKQEVITHQPNSSDTRNGTQYNFVDQFLFYNSFIFTTISIISLSFLILLYTTREIFHNFGGYLTVCLSISLCLTNLVTLLVTNSTIVQSPYCKTLAIIQHFVSISTFVWMSVFALDLLQTFGLKSTNRSQKKSFKTFVLYCIGGLSISTVLVGTSTVIEFTVSNNSTIRPKYGGLHCWFTSKYGGIIWYFIPVCLMLMWNFGICVLVFYRLIKNAKDCKVIKIQNKDSNSTLWLCIRLTAVFGIGYVFQILAVLTTYHVMIIMGSIINCLQGFLLMICFFCTKRAKSEITKTISSMKTSESQTTSTSKSSQKKTISVTISKTDTAPPVDISKL